MVCLKGNELSYVSLENVIGHLKLVDPSCELVKTAESTGVSFGA